MEGRRKKECNEDDDCEVESYEDFLKMVVGEKVTDLAPFVFQEVDFSAEPPERWAAYAMTGAWFFGCLFPEGVTAQAVRSRGATVLANDDTVPFKLHRSRLYTQSELIEHSDTIYHYYKAHSDVSAKLKYAAHDFSISDALAGIVALKSVVSFMGGHQLSRADAMYRQIVRTAWGLARDGFLVATGGGPGAMEAGNLGAYLADRSEEELEEAIAIISQPSALALASASSDSSHAPISEYLDNTPAKRVLERFGSPKTMPSIGVPTFFYGHEPSNLFASFHAKYFENALREDMLIKISNAGIIFAPGSAGTRQGILQFPFDQ